VVPTSLSTPNRRTPLTTILHHAAPTPHSGHRGRDAGLIESRRGQCLAAAPTRTLPVRTGTDRVHRNRGILIVTRLTGGQCDAIFDRQPRRLSRAVGRVGCSECPRQDSNLRIRSLLP
jgi:hypothetical protein